MSISMYDASVPCLCRALSNLVGVLEKAAAHAETRGIDPTVLIQSRLYPDMFPLVRQVQIAADLSRRGVARLAGVEAPAVEDRETSFPELIQRLQGAIAYLKDFTPDQINGTEEKSITVPIGGGQFMTMAGWPFLSFFVLPNVLFHVTTAYAILRHNGVELGKRDFLGQP